MRMPRRSFVFRILLGCVFLIGAFVYALRAPRATPDPVRVVAQPLPAAVAAALPVPRIAFKAAAKSTTPPGDSLPHFTLNADGAYTMTERHFSAAFSADKGLSYRPTSDGTQTGDAGELKLQLRQVNRGSEILFATSQDSKPARVKKDELGHLTVFRGPIAESYVPRRDGVEQRFVVEEPLKQSGAGDVEFSFDVAISGLSAVANPPGRNGGILFCDTHGNVAARYGQVLVTDKNAKALVLEPHLNAAANTISFAIPERWLASAAYPVTIDPLVGTDFQVSADNPNGIAPPCVVGGISNFLVIWDDFTVGAQSPTLVASVVTQSAVVSNPIRLSSLTAAPRPYALQRVEAAFDGANWLVVWSEDDSGGAAIHGAIVASGMGTTTVFGGSTPAPGTILGSTDFEIAKTTATIEELPICAYNGTDFIVAWMSGPTTSTGVGTGSQLLYTRVTSSGAVSPPTALPSRTNPPSQGLLLLAPQLPSGDTLLVYRETTEKPAQSRATRIGTDGTLRDPGGISLFLSDQQAGGFGLPIGAAFINNEWQVLSSYDETTSSSIFLHHVSTAGTVTPPTGTFGVMGLGPTGNSIDTFAPAFAGSASWLFLRNEKVNGNVFHILGKRVGFDGTDQDPTPFQADTATQGALHDAVAAQAGGAFLVAWADGRRGTPQPGQDRNVFAVLVDAAIADPGTALVPIISASPLTGLAPLPVSFDSSGSSGSFDSLSWNFGDGTTSTSAQVAHTYTKNGSFTAQLTLTKGSYQVSQTVVIVVGGGSGPVGSTGGTQVGAPVQNSDGIVSSLLISSIQLGLDFTSQKNDVLKITGVTDIGQLPNPLTGVSGSVSLGGLSFPFTLDAKGQFISDATQIPVVTFAVGAQSGNFAITITKATLQPALETLGANNDNVSPAILVDVPITLAINGSTATATESIQYHAKKNASGVGVYSFGGKGKTTSGSFIVTKFSAQEVAIPSGGSGHNYMIQGVLLRPGGLSYTLLPTGQLSFQIGNYSISLPAGQFLSKPGNLKFSARVGASGLKKFLINPNKGNFTLQLVGVPSPGVNGSGLPLSSVDNTVNVDLNLSFQFDLTDQRLNAGRYIFISRKSATAKSWTLR